MHLAIDSPRFNSSSIPKLLTCKEEILQESLFSLDTPRHAYL